MDPVINWFSGAFSLSEFQPTIDGIVNGNIVSQTSCLAAKINSIVEKFIGHKFSVMSNTSVENYALLVDWGLSFLQSLQPIKDSVINRDLSFLHILQPIKDFVINKVSSFDLHNLQHTMNSVINELVSLISLVTEINGDLLLLVVVAMTAIVVAYLLWTVICTVVSLLVTKVISPVVSLSWKVIFAVVRFLWKMIKAAIKAAIFGFGKGGKTMKAPGRNYRIYRNDFEDNPANYFRNLRK